MASALQQQLQALRAQAAGPAVVQRARPSLLFSEAVAAQTDLETVRLMAVNGLEQLLALSPAFGDFRTLVSAAAKGPDRALSTPEENAALDVRLNQLLRLLGAVFPMPAAHKVVEWLIWRFRVHELNVPAMVDMVLPYYETKIFARVVGLLHLASDAQAFYWLESVRTSGVPLTRTAMLQRLRKDPAVLRTVVGLFTRYPLSQSDRRLPQPLLALVFSMASGVLAAAPPVGPDTLATLLPLLIDALRRPDPDLQSLATALVAQLASLGHDLEQTVLHALAELVAGALSALPDPALGLGCLAVLCRQPTLRDCALPPGVAQPLLALAGLVTHLAALTVAGSAADALHTALIHTLVSQLPPQPEGSPSLATLQAVLDQVALADPTAQTTARLLVEHFRQHQSPSLGPLIARLETRYPAQLDHVLSVHVPRPTDDVAWPRQLLALCHSPLRQQTVPAADDGSLLLCLQHPLPKVRMAAVGTLGKALEHHPGGDATMASLLADRLRDYDDEVARRALALGPVLTRHLQPELLLDVLCERLHVRPGATLPRASTKTARKILRFVTGHFVPAFPKHLPAAAALLLGFVLHTPQNRKQAVAALEGIAAAPALLACPLFAGLPALLQRADWQALPPDDHTARNHLLLQTLAVGAARADGVLRAALALPSLARHVAVLILVQHVLQAEPADVSQPLELLLAACRAELASGAAISDRRTPPVCTAGSGPEAVLLPWVQEHADAWGPQPPRSRSFISLVLGAVCASLPGPLRFADTHALLVALAQLEQPRLYAAPLQLLFHRLVKEPLPFVIHVLSQRDVAPPTAALALALAAAQLQAGAGHKMAVAPFRSLCTVLCAWAGDADAAARAAALHAMAALAQLPSLPQPELAAVLAQVPPHAAAIQADPSALPRALQAAVGGAAAATLTKVVKLAVETPERQLQAKLLAALHLVHGQAKLEVLHPVMAKLLDACDAGGFESLAADEQSVLYYALRAMTPDTAGAFKPSAGGNNAFFDTLCRALRVADAHGADSSTPQAWVLRHALVPALFEELSSGQMSTIVSQLCNLLQRHGGQPVYQLLLATLSKLPVCNQTLRERERERERERG